jgi:hypothetical protein
MAMQRKNPVPPGRYWVDQFNSVGPYNSATPQDGIGRFERWLSQNKDKVRLVRREKFNSLFAGKERAWYLFDVVAPVVWEKGWGFPTIVQAGATPSAPMTVQTSEDTVQKPPEESAFQGFTDLFADVKAWAIVAGLIYLMTQSKGSR